MVGGVHGVEAGQGIGRGSRAMAAGGGLWVDVGARRMQEEHIETRLCPLSSEAGLGGSQVGPDVGSPGSVPRCRLPTRS